MDIDEYQHQIDDLTRQIKDLTDWLFSSVEDQPYPITITYDAQWLDGRLRSKVLIFTPRISPDISRLSVPPQYLDLKKKASAALGAVCQPGHLTIHAQTIHLDTPPCPHRIVALLRKFGSNNEANHVH